MAHDKGLCKILFPVLKGNQTATKTQGSAHLEFGRLPFFKEGVDLAGCRILFFSAASCLCSCLNFVLGERCGGLHFISAHAWGLHVGCPGASRGPCLGLLSSGTVGQSVAGGGVQGLVSAPEASGKPDGGSSGLRD